MCSLLVLITLKPKFIKIQRQAYKSAWMLQQKCYSYLLLKVFVFARQHKIPCKSYYSYLFMCFVLDHVYPCFFKFIDSLCSACLMSVFIFICKYLPSVTPAFRFFSHLRSICSSASIYKTESSPPSTFKLLVHFCSFELFSCCRFFFSLLFVFDFSSYHFCASEMFILKQFAASSAFPYFLRFACSHSVIFCRFLK